MIRVCIMSSTEIEEQRRVNTTTTSEESASSMNSSEGAEFAIKIQTLTSEINDFMVTKPQDLHEVVIHRRRKTTTEEFSQTLSSLRSETRKLKVENTNAEKLSGLAKSATDGFKGAIRLTIISCLFWFVYYFKIYYSLCCFVCLLL